MQGSNEVLPRITGWGSLPSGSAFMLDQISAPARTLDDSGIVAILNYCGHRDDIVRLWVGEGDLPAPAFAQDAVRRSLDAGETFYTYQRGIPELREALAAYHRAHWNEGPIDHDVDRFTVTGSGMQAIQLATLATCEAGDEAIMLSPGWPNIHEAIKIAGATPVEVPLDFSPNGWSLDVERLRAAVGPKTRMIFINTPANPTGYTSDTATLRAILDLARERGVWIVADEVYGRFTYDPIDGRGRAPSFYDIAEPDDRVIFVNTFSKNWALTGFRLGWISAPPILGSTFENLVQYSTSGCPVFVQRAAIGALGADGEAFFQMQRERAGRNRDVLCDVLSRDPRIRFAKPPAALYLFFLIEGETNSVDAARRLIDETGVAPAPGSAFYQGGEGWLRVCFLRDPAQIDDAARRLSRWLGS